MTGKKLEDLVAELLAEVRTMKAWAALPTVLTKARAARELSVSLSKLKKMIREGELMVCEVGKTTMVPASEVQRIAQVERRQATDVPQSERARLGKRPKKSAPTEADKIRSSLRRSR